MPNDRSDAALRERLVIAEKATQGPWAFWEWKNGVMEIRSHADPDEEHVCRVWNKEDGEFLRANSPREVKADLEEIMRLRAENEQLRGEVESLNKQADWLVRMLSLYTEDCPLKFSWVYAEKLPIPKIDGCDGAWPDEDYFDCSNSTPEKCWREAARKAVEEEEHHG